jgi:glycosyltransferase involved in cell wall biosynthesis
MTTDTVGGVLTYTRDLAGALRGRGVEVVVAELAGHELEWAPDPWDGVEAAGRRLLELEERLRPDVIHLNGYAHGGLPWRAPCLVVAHSDVCSWFEHVRGVGAGPEWDRYRREVTAGLRAADAVVSITGAVADDVLREFGVRSEVVYNGSPLEPCAPRKEPLVLGAGRLWDEAKNLRALDAAAEGLEWPVVVAGEMGAARVRFARAVGQLSPAELAALRGRAAIFCSPALYEPFGLAILEAARDRCALVLGDVASLRELWDGAAVFVDPADPSALRAALSALAADRVERDRLAAAAQERSLDFPVPAAAYAALYERLADRTRFERGASTRAASGSAASGSAASGSVASGAARAASGAAPSRSEAVV